MKRTITIALAIITLLSASVFAINTFAATDATEPTAASESKDQTSSSAKHGKKEKVAEPENAVGKDAAKAAALKDAGVSADATDKIKARVSKLDDGTVVYKVSFTAGETYYSYRIDALTGKIAEKTEMSAEEHEAAKAERKSSSRHGKKESVTEPENAVGKDAAKAAALKDAGLSADRVDKIMCRVTSLEDGTVVYRIGFDAGETHYSYKINALTGTVADRSEMSVEEHAAARPQAKHHGKKATSSADTETP